MTKRTGAAVAVIVCFIAFVIWRDGRASLSEEALPATPKGATDPAGSAASEAVTTTKSGGLAAGSEQDTLIVAAIEEESDVLSMYDEMTTGFASHPGDCAAMATVVEHAIVRHGPALQRLQQRRARLTPQQDEKVRQRLSASHGERMAMQRRTVEQVVARCKRHTGLMDALRRLAGTGGQRLESEEAASE